jgi:hypothetical protein
MKKTAILLGLIILTCGVGMWLGRATTPTRPIVIQKYAVFVTCGGGNYPKEAFARVNDEIPERLDTLLGDNEHLGYLVAVTPDSSGYKVAIAGLAGSKLWDKAIQKKLSDWINQRMDAIQLETPTKVEQVVPPNGP